MGPPIPTPAFPYTGAIAKTLDLRSSMSSQDSGINMCFNDPDDKARGKDRNRTISAQLEESTPMEMPQRRVVSESGVAPSPPLQDHTRLPTTPEVDPAAVPTSKLTRQPNVLKSSPSQDLSEAVTSGSSSVAGTAKWHNLPKDIWKQAAEALDDFGMLREGDRVLVCLSGSSSSLCLLHLLRQFVRARRLANVTLATVSFGDVGGGIDPRALMLYLRELQVDYYCEPHDAATENLQDKLVTFAGRRGFNVLAMANTLDKLADRFLMSLLYQGHLHTTQAVTSTDAVGDQPSVRIIRPLLYLREHSLEDFAATVALPSRPSRLFTRPPDVANSILRVQEAANPAVYGNIRSALKPLLAMRVESTKSTYESIRAALVSRD